MAESKENRAEEPEKDQVKDDSKTTSFVEGEKTVVEEKKETKSIVVDKESEEEINSIAGNKEPEVEEPILEEDKNQQETEKEEPVEEKIGEVVAEKAETQEEKIEDQEEKVEALEEKVEVQEEKIEDQEEQIEEAVAEEVETVKENTLKNVELATSEEPESTEALEQPVADESPEPEKEETSEDVETPAPAANQKESKEEQEEESKDYSVFSKEQLVEEIELLANESTIKKSTQILKEIQPLFSAMIKKERADALKKFTSEGGEEDDFEYQHGALDNRFDASLRLLKDRKSKYHREQESLKQSNLESKNELLERLRHLVDGEETTTSINVLKDLQKEWKEIGMVPHAFVKSLWANYNALIDRFYDNRSIYFELKELDRKKNMVLKEELCQKAESLESVSSLNEAISQLNELHEEYKHVGPVPREDQETLWQRFKAASDKVYARRKEYIDEIKKDLHKNYESKKAIISDIVSFGSFNSDRINDWNAKTKEIIGIQKKWEAIGGLPRDKAKEVNKEFWGSFKTFFSNKNAFFKTLEGLREENMKKKEELIAKAEELKESLDWEETAKAFKKLQLSWKDIGPVPQKKREEVYGRFKAACDFFFENRRAKSQTMDSEYQENYDKKVEICQELLSMAKKKSSDQDRLSELIEHWNEIGFVPKKSIKDIQTKFFDALEEYLKKSGLSDEEQEKWRITAKFSNLKSKPNSNSRLNSKENNLRKQISQLESDISLWRNNLEFFASSKTAEKLKQEFDQKIVKAEDQLSHLKDELKIIKQM